MLLFCGLWTVADLAATRVFRAMFGGSFRNKTSLYFAG